MLSKIFLCKVTSIEVLQNAVHVIVIYEPPLNFIHVSQYNTFKYL